MKFVKRSCEVLNSRHQTVSDYHYAVEFLFWLNKHYPPLYIESVSSLYKET